MNVNSNNKQMYLDTNKMCKCQLDTKYRLFKRIVSFLSIEHRHVTDTLTSEGLTRNKLITTNLYTHKFNQLRR